MPLVAQYHGLKTACVHGHDWTEYPPYLVHRSNGKVSRACAECQRQGRRARSVPPKTQCLHGHEFTEANTRLYRGKRYCRTCIGVYGRQRNAAKERPALGRRISAARDGDQRQARRRIGHLVEVGLIPDPNAIPCTDCGHVWVPGKRRHEYDHHLGYAAEHHEHVEAVCTTCHNARTRRAAR